METKTNAEKVMTSMGTPTISDTASVIGDKFLRRAVIDASMKLEQMLKDGKIKLDAKIKTVLPWGLEIHGNMSQIKEDKPIIFKYGYRVDRAKFKAWVDEHRYLMDGPVVVFESKGIRESILRIPFICSKRNAPFPSNRRHTHPRHPVSGTMVRTSTPASFSVWIACL